jgi:SAM-dependent methyltransferase
VSSLRARAAFDPDAFVRGTLPLLGEAWGAGDVYQFDNPRSRNVLERLSFLAGCRVLDIGSNTGMYAFALAPLAASVHGIDSGERFVQQAEAAKAALAARGKDVSNVTFEWHEVAKLDPDETDVDAVLACNVLYHLNDVEMGILERLLASCRKAFFQMRPRRVLAFERNRETFFYVSQNSVCGGMYTLGHALEFLQTCGFRRFEIHGEERYWGDEPFPVLLAERD